MKSIFNKAYARYYKNNKTSFASGLDLDNVPQYCKPN